MSGIASVDKIEVEYAPKPKENDLNDKTSFDAYIEYTNLDAIKGMEYMDLLFSNDNKFIALTFEDFFTILSNHCPDNNYEKWLDYLKTRYIVENEC